MDLKLDFCLPEVQELCKEDLKKSAGGGILMSALSAFAFMYAIDVAVNWSDHVTAFKKGYYQAKN